MMTTAFMKAFTKRNICSAFKKAGVWPVNTETLLGTSLPRSASDPDTMLNPDQLQEMLRAKRRQIREDGPLQPVVVKRGSLDTTYGQVVSRDEAIKVLQAARDAHVARQAERAAKEAQEDLAFQQQREKKRGERKVFEQWALKRRISAYGDPDISPRPLKLRVAAVKERARSKQAAQAANSGRSM